MNYKFKKIEVDYRYWFAQQILFSLLDFCSFDKHLAEECRNLAFYCDKFCGIPSSLSNIDLIETKAYYKLKIKVEQEYLVNISQAAGIVRRRKEQTVELYDLFGNIYFSSFQDVVEFMCGSTPHANFNGFRC